MTLPESGIVSGIVPTETKVPMRGLDLEGRRHRRCRHAGQLGVAFGVRGGARKHAVLRRHLVEVFAARGLRIGLPPHLIGDGVELLRRRVVVG